MAFIEAKHWRDLPPGSWRWPNFTPQELACRGTGKIKISTVLMDKLQALRATVGPLHINSGYRSPEYNATLPGAVKDSQHTHGTAVDISMAGHDPLTVYETAKGLGFLGFGFYPEPRNNFMHLDVGAARWWGNPVPWGIDPKKQVKKIARRSGVGMSAVGFAGETAQQIAYQAQLVSDVSDWIRIGAAVVGGIGLLLLLWSNLQTKEKEQ